MAQLLEENRSSFQEINSLIWDTPTKRFIFSKIDEVYPGIFLGGIDAALDVDLLSHLGITHIINAAYQHYHVRTNEEYYNKKNDLKCEFMGIVALDNAAFQLHPFFDESAEFIHKALQSNGKIYVHCMMGASRSATLVICYLIIKKNMSAADAVKLILSKRNISPNPGFIQQLCDLESRIIAENMAKQ